MGAMVSSARRTKDGDRRPCLSRKALRLRGGGASAFVVISTEAAKGSGCVVLSCFHTAVAPAPVVAVVVAPQKAVARRGILHSVVLVAVRWLFRYFGHNKGELMERDHFCVKITGDQTHPISVLRMRFSLFDEIFPVRPLKGPAVCMHGVDDKVTSR